MISSEDLHIDDPEWDLLSPALPVDREAFDDIDGERILSG